MTPDPYRYLTPNERVVFSARRHIAALLPTGLIALGVVAVVSLLGAITTPSDNGTPTDTLLGAVAGVFVLRFIWKAWQWWIDRVVVTNQRIFEVSGILTRSVASMPLMRVTDMTYRRSLIGRVLGYGDLIVESAGNDQALRTIDRLPRPDDLYRTIASLVVSGLPTMRPDDGTGRADDVVPEPEDTGPLPRISF